MKKVYNGFINFLKILFTLFIGLFSKSDKKESKVSSNTNNIKDNKSNQVINPTSNTETTLPDKPSTKVNPDTKVELFTYDEIEFILFKYFKDRYELDMEKVLDTHDREFLEEYDKFNKKFHEKIDEDIATGWVIVNEDDLIKRTEYHVEDYFNEKKRLFELPEVIEKRNEELKNKKDIIEEPIIIEEDNNIKLDNEIPKVNTTSNKIVNTTIDKKEDIKETIIEKEKEPVITSNNNNIVIEPPTLDLKQEVVNVVLASSLVMASIAKEIISAPTSKEVEEPAIKKEDESSVSVEPVIEDVIDVSYPVEEIEVKKEDIIEEIESIEQEIINEINEEKKEQLKESLEELKKQEVIIEKEITKKEEVNENFNKIELDIRPFEYETKDIIKDTQKEQMKVDFEDKNYDALEEEIDRTINKIEDFIIKNEKYLTKEQKEQLRKEQKNLNNIKDNINTQKEADIRVEEHRLEESILHTELDTLKERIKALKVEEQLELEKYNMKKYEDLDKQAKKDLPKIEKNLLKNKVKKASRLAAITSLSALPFIHNPYFLFFTTGVLIKSHLLGMHSVLRHKQIVDDEDIERIKTGKDALEQSLDSLVNNMNHLDYLVNESITKYPELANDKEYVTYVNTLRNRLNKNYDKLIKKQYTIDKYLYKSKKDIKILKRQKKKNPNNH